MFASQCRVDDERSFPADGAGPLLQRDYWAVFSGCRMRPSQILSWVKEHFCELPPKALVEFTAPDGLGRDAVVDILIKPGQQARVRVIHDDAQSLTLGTLSGHPESGRITFGAYRNPNNDVVFHIRSRARSSDGPRLFGFIAVGEAMQTDTWTDFITSTAHGVGAQIVGGIRAETTRVDDTPEDSAEAGCPTYLAVGD